MASRKEYEMLFQLNAQLGSSYNTTFSQAQARIASMQREIQALSKTQSDISAFQKQQSAVEATRVKLSVLQQQYDNIQKEIKETEGFSASLENKLLSKQQQIDKTSASLGRQTEKLQQMDSALKDAGINTANLAKESVTLTSKMDNLKDRQIEVANSASEFEEKSSHAFSVVQQAIAAAGIGASLKGIYDGYMDCISLAGDFEETMSTVKALSGASDGEMRQLNALAKEQGATTKFTAKESGEAMTYMGMAGWDAAQMLQGMDGVLQLASASGEDLALVSDIVTDNLTAFGLKASDTARFSDVLAAAATNSNTSVSIMGETFKNSASIAGALKYSVEDVAVATGLMANSGVKGSRAGTALKNIFNGLLNGVTLTGKALGDVEFKTVNTDGTMKTFGSTINELRGYFSQLTEAEKVNNAVNIAGERGYNGLLAIINSTEDDYNGLYESINNCTGAASKMAKIKLDNLNGQLTIMNSAQDALKTSIGEQFNPELRNLYAIGTDILTMSNKFVENNPSLVKGVTAFVGVVGLATAGMTAYATVAKVVKALELGSLFSAGAPVMIAIGAIATVTAGIVGIVDAYNEAQIAARRYGDEVSAAADEYKQAMSESNELSSHIRDWKELNATISSGTAPVEEVKAAKDRLKDTEQWLIDNYGVYMDRDGTVSEEEIQSLETRNKELVKTAELQAKIALYNAKEKFESGKIDVKELEAEYVQLGEKLKPLELERSILSEHLSDWKDIYMSDEYKNASDVRQQEMFNNALSETNADLRKAGFQGNYNGFNQVGVTEFDLSKEAEKIYKKRNGIDTQLNEYYTSENEYKNAVRQVNELNLGKIPTENLKEFAAAAKEIGKQAANAELETSELEKYAETLTAVAHNAGLLPENQKIVFNADGALNVLEQVANGVDELDGKTAEITADANADAAYMKINGVMYKVLGLDETTGIATLSADGTKATAQINLKTNEVRLFGEEEAAAWLSANTETFDENIKHAKSVLTNFPAEKTITIKSVFKSVYETTKSILGLGDGYATGTANATPGWHLVGENGPEIVYFGGGESVYTADETRRMLNGAQEEMQIVSFLPLFQNYITAMNAISATNRVEPIGAYGASGGQYKITIAPQLTVQGGATDDIDGKFQEFSDIIVGNVLDALDEAGINAKRGAYV